MASETAAAGDGWVPASHGQRPPFGPGHELSMEHGAYSPRRVNPLAGDLVGRVLSDQSMSYAHTPAFRPALWAWARAEAQVQLVTEYLEERGKGGVGDLADERVRAAYLLLHRAEARADRSRARLGMDPLSRARLGRDVAQGAAADAAVALTRAREEAERRAQDAASGAEGDGSDG